MKLWSQIARLGAAVAALSPAVAEAEDEPEQADVPTLDTNNQPVAASTISAESVDPDANLIEDMALPPEVHAAVVPPVGQLSPQPEHGSPGPLRTRSTGGAKPHARVMPHGKSWHGGGQRYGG